MSSSWKLETSQTTTSPGSILPVEVAQRTADVAGHRRAEHHAEQLARRRLPVRPGDADDRVREQPRAELDLAPDGNPAGARSRDERRLAGHSRALDQCLDAVEQTLLLGPEMEFDAGLGKPAHVDVRRRIDSDHLLPASPEREGRRLPRARQAQDESTSRKRHFSDFATVCCKVLWRPVTAAL